MEKEHLQILLEDIRSKTDLVLEGHEVLNAKIDASQEKSDDAITRHNEGDGRIGRPLRVSPIIP